MNTPGKRQCHDPTGSQFSFQDRQRHPARLRVQAIIAVAVGLTSLALVRDAKAVTRYMGGSGSDNHSCAASEDSNTPKKTFAAAKACMVPGDTLKILPGTYSDQLSLLNMSGTSAARYTVSGMGTVTFVSPDKAESCRTIITSSSTKFVTLENVTIDGSQCTFFQSGPDKGQNKTGNRIDGATDLTLRNVHIGKSNISSLYLTNGARFLMEGGSLHSNLSNNCLPGTRSYGAYVHDFTDAEFRGVAIYGNAGGGIQAYPGPIQGFKLTKSRIYDNNHCTTSPLGGVLVQASSDAGGPIDKVIIANNEIFSNGLAASHGNAPGLQINGKVSNVEVFHNLIYNNKKTTAAPGGNGYGISFNSTDLGSPSGVTIQNNVIVENQTGAISLGPATNTTILHNACGTDENCGATGKVSIAAVTACTISTQDFRHRPDSSCIDVATSIASVTDDINGIMRPQGVSSDLGPHEHGDDDTQAPKAPTGLIVQ